MPVNRRSLQLQTQLEQQLQQVTNQQTRALVSAWVRAWDETAPDLQDAVDELVKAETAGVVAKALVTRNTRLLAALDQIGRSLTTLASQAGVRILGDVRTVVDTAAARQAAIISAQLPREAPGVPSLVNAATLDAIVQRTATQITARTYRLAPDAYDAVQRELLRGIVVGSNPRHTAERILARTQTEFNGGLARAMTIARTETLDAHRAGAAAGQTAHAAVLTGWVWNTHLSARTCPACLAMNGRVFPLTQAGPEGHPNCRCGRTPVTKSWTELGIDLPEPVDLRPTPESTRAWFEALSEREQLGIMGPERLRLLRSGAIRWDDLATLRPNPGWRPSWQITPVRDLQTRVAQPA